MKKLALSILIVSLLIFTAGSLFAEKSAFQGDPSETYYMCVMVSGVEYWFPVYEMFKQAGQQLGVKTVYTGTPEYDVNKQLAVFEQILAKHSDMIDPMNDYKREGFNPMQVPYADNGLSLVSKDNADDFYWDKYLKRRGTKGIKE